MKNIETPSVRPLRSQGGTLYTFYSALEDIGLNINENRNVIKLTNYALLNIPDFDTRTDIDGNILNIEKNKFNVFTPNGAKVAYEQKEFEELGINSYISESFRRYALNMENAILNNDTYDYTTALNTSERIFWKWLKECGAIRWEYDKNNLIKESTNTEYNRVVQAIGKIDAVSQRAGTSGLYNEIFVNIPSSLGRTEPIIFNHVPDNNYYHEMIVYCSKNVNDVDNTTCFYDGDTTTTPDWATDIVSNTSDDIKYYYVIDSSVNDDVIESTYNNITRSKFDCLTLNFNLQDGETFDSLSSTDNSGYFFNTILLYYSVFDKNNLEKPLATNLYGVYFLNAPSAINEDSSDINVFSIPALEKIKSNNNGFGTSYSFKINLRTKSIYDNSSLSIIDNSSSDNSLINDFNNVVHNLGECVELVNRHVKNTDKLIYNYKTVNDNIKIIKNQLDIVKQNIENLSNSDYDIGNFNEIHSPHIETNNIIFEINDDIYNNDIMHVKIKDTNPTSILSLDSSFIKIGDDINYSTLSNSYYINNYLNDDGIDASNLISSFDAFIKDNISIISNKDGLLNIQYKDSIQNDGTKYFTKDNKIDLVSLIAYLLYKEKNR